MPEDIDDYITDVPPLLYDAVYGLPEGFAQPIVTPDDLHAQAGTLMAEHEGFAEQLQQAAVPIGTASDRLQMHVANLNTMWDTGHYTQALFGEDQNFDATWNLQGLRAREQLDIMQARFADFNDIAEQALDNDPVPPPGVNPDEPLGPASLSLQSVLNMIQHGNVPSSVPGQPNYNPEAAEAFVAHGGEQVGVEYRRRQIHLGFLEELEEVDFQRRFADRVRMRFTQIRNANRNRLNQLMLSFEEEQNAIMDGAMDV